MLIISHKSSLEFKDFLDRNNFSWIETIDNPNLDKRIADHPDLTIFNLDNKSLVIDKNMVDYYKKSPLPNIYCSGYLVNYGADDEIRTRDPRLGKAMLYH